MYWFLGGVELRFEVFFFFWKKDVVSKYIKKLLFR